VLGGRGKFRDSNNPADYAAVRHRLAQLFPQLGEVSWQYFWGGRVALTADHYPHLHRLAPELYAALGYNGRGVAMASRLGALVAEWLLGRPDDELPVPVQPLQPIPLHRLRRPALSLLVSWKRMLDAKESRRGR
jgi:glycine/D-amino acid oxidase-like deaminating enzyme